MIKEHVNYKDNWKNIKLQKLGTTYSGLTGKNKDDFNTGESKFISYMNIYLNPSLKKEALVNVRIKKGEKQNKVKYGDLFFTTSSETPEEVGISSVLLEDLGCDAYLNSFCFGFRLHDFETIEPNFAKYYFRGQSFRKQMFRIAQGATRFNLSKKYFIDTEIHIPSSINEQKRIVSMLGLYDRYLEAIGNEIRAKKNIKKYLMETLLLGKVRLKGFSKKWQTYELGQMLKYEQPGKYIVNNTDYVSSGTPVLTANKSFVLGYTDEKDGIYDKLPVIIFDDFTTLNKFVDFPFKVKSSAMKILKPKSNEFDIQFVYERMQLLRYVVGEHKRCYLSEYQYLDVKVPEIKEQQAIAFILFSADKEIETLEAKKRLVEQQRKYLLNNLITGNIRVPETIGNNLN